MDPASPIETTTPTLAVAQPVLIKKQPLAALLSVSTRTIDTWVAKRDIPYLSPSPRLHLFDPEAVKAALVAKFGVQPRSPAWV